MALNSKREQIMLAVVAKLNTLTGILKVSRRRPTLEQLTSIANTELPQIAVTAGLPVPNPHFDEQGRLKRRDLFISELGVEVVFYDMLYDDDSYDATISSFADDLWVALNSDQTWGGLAVETEIEPDSDITVYDPYLAFRMKLTIKYIHGIGGI